MTFVLKMMTHHVKTQSTVTKTTTVEKIYSTVKSDLLVSISRCAKCFYARISLSMTIKTILREILIQFYFAFFSILARNQVFVVPLSEITL